MGTVRKLITAEDHICALDAFDGTEQELKDKIHEKMNRQCEFEEDSGCWMFTGAWQNDGQGVIRVGQKKYTVLRAAAWIYIVGFHLEDNRFAFRTCRKRPACFNPAHIRIAETRSEGMRQMHAFGSWGQGKRKLNQAVADALRLAYSHMPPGLERADFIRQQAKSLSVTPVSVARIIDDITWARTHEKPSGLLLVPGADGRLLGAALGVSG